MTEKLQETIKEQMGKLPAEARRAIDAFDWVKVTEEIGATYSFTEDEINNFQAETALVLSGLVDPEFYAVNIENHVNTTKNQAKEIADEVAQKVFIPIRNILDENIRKDLQDKNVSWKQNIDFVLSGGDYTHFLEQRNDVIKE